MAMIFVLVISSLPLYDRTEAQAASKEKIFVPSMAVMSGKQIYMALGTQDQGGPLYSYNTSAKKKKKISNLNCFDLNLKGNYIYCTVNNYYGSDGNDYYIYKISKSGKKTKKLAKGKRPVVMGKYIYYIGMKQESSYFSTSGEPTGIYRMNLDGKGKKCIKKFTGAFTTSQLTRGNNRIIFRNDYTLKYYCCGTNGKVRGTSISSKKMSVSAKDFSPYTSTGVADNLPLSYNSYGYTYTTDGSKLVRKGSSSKKTLHKFKQENGNLGLTVDMGSYLMVSINGWRAYIISKSGKTIKHVFTGLIG